MKWMKYSILILLFALPAQSIQERKDRIDPMEVDDAIDKGRHWLLQQPLNPFTKDGPQRNDELVLYTLLHAGEDLSRPEIQARIDKILTAKLESNYPVVLQAMFLQEYNAVKYQWRIAQCGQFLVDNQCQNGQWGYGEETEQTVDVPTVSPKDVETKGGKEGKSGRPAPVKPKRPITIKAQRTGPEKGDNSNSQYAALGLRACLEANVILPMTTLIKGIQWWETSQNKDGGWGYGTNASYGSMTAGAVASLIILKDYSRQSWMKAQSVCKGIFWLDKNWTVKDNPVTQPWWHYYYLYAVERVGMLGGFQRIGRHQWYEEGARFLIDNQREDGSWVNATRHNKGDRVIWDTCFAILFLKRATAPVPTQSKTKGR